MDFLTPIALPAAAAAWTAFRARAIEAAYPPAGVFVDTRAGRLHLTDAGAGDQATLFLHGASGNLRVWRSAFGDRLDRLGRVILVDRPGHGFSEREAGRAAASLAYQAGAMADALDALGVARATVAAHSWAGALAMRMALDFPDRVSGLVLLAPATHPWPGGVSWYYGVAARPVLGRLFVWTLTLPAGEIWMRQGVRGVFAPQPINDDYAHDAAIPLLLRPSQFKANAEDCAALLAEITGQAPRYGEIACPLTVISGDADEVVWTHLHSEGLKRDVASTRLIVLPGVGHAPHHADPDLVIAEIARMNALARPRRLP